jgi:hypothetical protein
MSDVRTCRICGKVLTQTGERGRPRNVCRGCRDTRPRGQRHRGRANTPPVTPPVRQPWDSDAEIELLRELCRRDFWTFFLLAFGAGSNPKGQRWIDEAIHKPLADWFQGHVLKWHEARVAGEGYQLHLAVVVHRELGKTTLITRAGQAWLHVLDPEMSTYTGAEGRALSSKMLNAIKAVLDGSDPHALFSRLYGNWSTGARTWTGVEVVHAARRNTSRQDPSFGTFAVETSIVGSHPDAIFYDDPISYDRLQSDSNWLSTVNSQVSSLIPVIQSDGLVVWPGTRYDDEDHYGIAFSTDGVASVEGMETDSITPTEDGVWHVYFLSGRDKDGKPSTPKVWPERRLKDYQRTDPIRYAAQVLNNPSLSELNPITREQLRQCVIPAKEVPWSALTFGIVTDLALWDGGKQANKDETVYEVWGYSRGGSGDVYFIEGYGSPTWRAEDFAKRLVATVQRYRSQGRRIKGITAEIAMAGVKGAWPIALRSYFHDANESMPPFYEIHRHSTKKELRLGAATSYWVDGHVRLVEGAPGMERLIEQMSRIGQYRVNPRIKIDWADAAADAFVPELYNVMRKAGQSVAPWHPGATGIAIAGLKESDFSNGSDQEWLASNPRPPLR